MHEQDKFLVEVGELRVFAQGNVAVEEQVVEEPRFIDFELLFHNSLLTLHLVEERESTVHISHGVDLLFVGGADLELGFVSPHVLDSVVDLGVVNILPK